MLHQSSTDVQHSRISMSISLKRNLGSKNIYVITTALSSEKHLNMSHKNKTKKNYRKMLKHIVVWILHQRLHQKSLCYAPIYKIHKNVWIFILTTTIDFGFIKSGYDLNITRNTADSNSHTCVRHTEELQVELHHDTLKEQQHFAIILI